METHNQQGVNFPNGQNWKVVRIGTRADTTNDEDLSTLATRLKRGWLVFAKIGCLIDYVQPTLAAPSLPGDEIYST